MARALGVPVKTYTEFEYEDMAEVKKQFKARRDMGMNVSQQEIDDAVTVQKWSKMLHEYGYDEHPHFTELAKYFEQHQYIEDKLQRERIIRVERRYVPTQMYALLTLRQLDPDHYDLCIVENPVHTTSTDSFELPVDVQFIRYENKSFANIEEVMSESLTHVPTRLARRCNLRIKEARDKKFEEWIPNLWIYVLPEEAYFEEDGKDLVLRYTFRMFAK